MLIVNLLIWLETGRIQHIVSYVSPTVVISTIYYTWSRCVTTISVFLFPFFFFIFSLKITITYLQPYEHMIAKAAPAEERLCLLQISVINVWHTPFKTVTFDCRCIEMTSVALHFLNNLDSVIDSLVSNSLLLHTLNTASICLMDHITLLVCCF